MINPEHKLFRWGTIDGRPLFIEYWQGGFVNFTKRFPPGWTDFIVYYEKEKCTVIADYKDLYDKGETVFKKYILPDKQFTENYQRWRKTLNKFKGVEKETNSKIQNAGREQLYKMIKKLNDFYINDFWNIGSLPEVANWGGEQLLGREIKKLIKSEQSYYLAMERLSAPEDFSFYQEEELELLKLKREGNRLKREIKLKQHQQKYFWILNSYHHTTILPVSHFRDILDSFNLKESQKKIKEIRKIKNNAVVGKSEIIKKLKLPKSLLRIGRRLAFCVWWQDRRKAYIFQANHLIDILLKKLSKLNGINFNDLHYYTAKEIEVLAEKGRKKNKKELSQGKKNLLVYFSASTKWTRQVAGAKAKILAKPYLMEKADKSIKEFNGIVVNQGKAVGTVKIILSPRQAHKLKFGDILVASFTSPDYIIALKRAAAVVTDRGGMTCHAAIVARELNIPGIVGTKIATKVLRDGDLVEVDADKGIVKILK